MPAQVPEPSGWKSVRSTYEDFVRTKYMSKDDVGKQLAAINYFMDRLQQDKDAILDGKKPPTY